jgi:hypothetical protein
MLKETLTASESEKSEDESEDAVPPRNYDSQYVFALFLWFENIF